MGRLGEVDEPKTIEEIAARVTALDTAFRLHVFTMSLLLKGHAGKVAEFLGSEVEQMPAAERFERVAVELLKLRAFCTTLDESIG